MTSNADDFLAGGPPMVDPGPPRDNRAIAKPQVTDQQRSIAEVQAAMMIARANPRDEIRAVEKITNAFQRQGLAEQALYSYSRGGTEITGPSIRSAEAIAQLWGNIQFGIRELEQSDDESVVQAFAWDVENNTRREMTFHVPHVRHTKRGNYKLTDPRDVYENVANQGARRVRACILAIIPGDVVETAVNQAEATMHAKADTSPEAVAKMVTAFASFGITKEQIEKRIQRRIDSIRPAQVVTLKKIWLSLRDGMSEAGDWFEKAKPVVVTPESSGPTPPPGASKPLPPIVGKAEKVNTDTGELTAEENRRLDEEMLKSEGG